MKFKKIENKYIVKLEKDEEVIETLGKFCQEEKIKGANIVGIGAFSQAILGCYEITTKSYRWQEFRGNLEVDSLVGNIALNRNLPFLHLHATLSNELFQSFGGHLKEARVGVTLELIVEKLETEIKREFDERIGLKLLSF